MHVTIRDVPGMKTQGPLATEKLPSEGQPRVSVVIIFFNEQRFLDAAVASVFAQTFPDWELLLVDDGSSDGSSDIAKGYAARDPARVRYLEHLGHENRGEGAARNLGVQAARCEWVAFLDGDDVWLPNRLERSLALARAHPDADVIYGKTEYWQSWEASGFVKRNRIQPHYFRANRVLRPPDLLVRQLSLRAAYPCMGSLLVRRLAFRAVGGFDESFQGIGQDLVFFAKLGLRHPIYVSDECWDRYRQHSGSMTGAAAQADIQVAQRKYLAWLDRYIEQDGLHDERVQSALHAAVQRTERSSEHWRSRLERIFRRVVRWRFEY
jgi:glycosyltransferase involved in cell wall biosynthesis